MIASARLQENAFMSMLDKRSITNWLKEHIPLLSQDRPIIRVLMFPAAEQNPYLLVTKQKIESLGGRVTMLESLEPSEVMRYAPTHDILHIFNIDEYRSPFVSEDFIKQLNGFSKRYSGIMLAKSLGMKVFFTLYNEPKGDYTSEWLERHARRLFYNSIDRIICPSESTRTELRKRYPALMDNRLTMLPHHNFGNFFPKQISPRMAREYLGVEAKGKVFLCFGGIHPYKGLTDIIPLFGKHPLKEHTLIVAGNPSNAHYAATIAGLCEEYENVHAFLRYVPTDDVQYFLQASDIFVMPYKDVLNSGSMMLALTFGKPLVAPAVGSIPEVANDKFAVLFEQGGSGALRDAMSAILEKDLESAAAEARRTAASYDADMLIRRLVNQYLSFFPKRELLPEEEEEL